MIGVSVITYDPVGAMIFRSADRDEMVNESGSRRCTRTATLDGGCEIYDTGYADSDRTVVVKEKNVTAILVDFVKYIIKNYGSVIVSMRDGVFTGTPESFDVSDGVLIFNILIKEKLT